MFVELREPTQALRPVAVPPILAHFHGLAPGEKISVELEPRLSLALHCLAIGEAEDDGSTRVLSGC